MYVGGLSRLDKDVVHAVDYFSQDQIKVVVHILIHGTRSGMSVYIESRESYFFREANSQFWSSPPF